MESTEVRRIVAEVLRISSDSLREDAALGVTSGWDSLAQLELIQRLESESGKRIAADDILFSESLPDLIELFSSQ
jgi:acyl carrier protein